MVGRARLDAHCGAEAGVSVFSLSICGQRTPVKAKPSPGTNDRELTGV